MTARILTENLIEDASDIIVTGEATGYEVDNLYDGRTSTWWKPGATGVQTARIVFSSAQTIDTFAVIGHNLGTEGCTIHLDYSTSSPISWTTLLTKTPTTDVCIFETDASGASAADWRIVITNCTINTLMGVIAIGQAIQLPDNMRAPFTPPNRNRDPEIINAETEGGQFIGRSVLSNGWMAEIKQDYIDPAWLTTIGWGDIAERIETNPFFFQWDTGQQAAYCWTEKIKYPEHTHQGKLFDSFSLSCRALIE